MRLSLRMVNLGMLMMMTILVSECHSEVLVWGVLYQSPCTGYQLLLTQSTVSCSGGIPKLSNWVQLGVKYCCCITYGSCIKSGCLLSLSYCQSPIVNPLLTHCCSIFGETQVIVYCLLSIVFDPCLVPVTYWSTDTHSLIRGIIINTVTSANMTLRLSDLLSDYLLNTFCQITFSNK